MERKCHFVTVIISCCFVRIVINVFLALMEGQFEGESGNKVP